MCISTFLNVERTAVDQTWIRKTRARSQVFVAGCHTSTGRPIPVTVRILRRNALSTTIAETSQSTPKKKKKKKKNLFFTEKNDLTNNVFILWKAARKVNRPSILTKKGKGFPYSIPSVGPGADPGVQAVKPSTRR